MAKTFLDQIVEYPSKIILRLAEDKYCVGLILNKSFNEITEEDKDKVLLKYIKDYQYIDDTNQETAAYIWVEVDINEVKNKTIKDTIIYVKVACNDNYMSLDPKTFPGIVGNRRDNIVRFIDRIINNSNFVGIGKIKLKSVRTISPISGLTARELIYEVPDFNIVSLTK